MGLIAASDALTSTGLAAFLVSLGLLLGLARIMGELARRYRQPQVLGEILAGVVLGPTLLAQFWPQAHLMLFPEQGPVAIAQEGFFQLGVAFLLLVAGLEVDLSSVWRQGKAAMSVSVTGILFPFVIGFGLAWLAPSLLGKDPAGELLPFALFVGIAMSITALPVIAKILIDLNMFKSDTGMLVMSAAMVNDLVGWLGFALVMATLHDQGGNVAPTILYTVVFAIGILTLGRWAANRTLPFVQAHSQWPGGVMGFVLVTALLCGAMTEWIGIHAIFGAFLAGVAIGDSNHLRERTRDTIHQFITNIFAPVFFASIGLRVNFIEAFDPLIVLVVLVVAIVGKVGGCYLGAVWAGLSKRESWATGFAMSARGAMEIILGELARQAQLITDELFVAIVIMALATSVLSGPMMQKLLRQRQRRRLKDFLAERQIILHPEARTLESILRELSSRAAELTGLPAGRILDTVLQREQIMHTGLPGGLAVPHARLDDLAKPCVVIARHPDGIDFDSPDGQPARLISLLLTPREQPEAQLELLDLVVRVFGQPPIRDRLLNAANGTEFLAILNQVESTGPNDLTPNANHVEA